MKLIYTHQNLILVENVRNVLEQEGIETQIKNGILSSGFGELSGIDTWPELWLVDPEYYTKAMQVVQSVTHPDETCEEGACEWVCGKCSERNARSFASCWSCQTPAQ